MIAVGRYQEIVAKVGAIGQEYICEGTLIPVLAKGLEHNFFFKTKGDAACFAWLPKTWPFSGQSISLRRTRSGKVLCRTSIVSPSRTPTTRPVNSVAKTELVTRSVRRTAQRQRIDRMLAGLSR